MSDRVLRSRQNKPKYIGDDEDDDNIKDDEYVEKKAKKFKKSNDENTKEYKIEKGRFSQKRVFIFAEKNGLSEKDFPIEKYPEDIKMSDVTNMIKAFSNVSKKIDSIIEKDSIIMEENKIKEQEQKKIQIIEMDNNLYKINIDIRKLPIYERFCNDIFNSLNVKDLDKDTLKIINKLNFETICGYFFIRLFRMLFFLDFIHDFYYPRNNNLKEDKDNIKKLLKKYNEAYKNDIQYIQIIYFSDVDFNIFTDYIDTIYIIYLSNEKNKVSLFDLDIKLQYCNDKIAKDISKDIINFFRIEEKNEDIYECDIFNKIIENIKFYNKKKSNDLNIFIDSGFEKVNICPLLNTLRNSVITENDKKITLCESIANDYDSSKGSSLKHIFNNFKENEYKRNKKTNNLKYKKFNKNNINIILKYGSNTILNIHLTPTKYDNNKNLTIDYDDSKNKNDNINIIVKNFFSIDNYENFFCEDSNQSNIREKLIKKENESEKFLLTSLCKTMGDFSQILLIYHLSEINPDKIYLLFTIDIIASYISSIFNYGTIRENSKNYLSPLSYFSNENYLTLSNNYGKYKKKNKLKKYYHISNNKDKLKKNDKKNNTKLLQKYAKKIGLPIKNDKNKLKSYKKLKNEINTLIKLSKKYSIVINKKLYSNLKKLYELQTIAKKNKVKITKKINGKYKYKTIEELKKNIKNI